MNSIRKLMALACAAPAVLVFTAEAAGPLAPKKGSGGSEIQGAAGPGSQSHSADQEHCEKPLGAIAVVEPQDHVIRSLSRYNLQSPTGLIRLMIQQSNCFIVVERGVAMQNMMQERSLAESGELRAGSNMGGGQMVSADFILTPAVVFSEDDAGGVGGAVAGLIPSPAGRAFGAVAGKLKFKEAQTSMLMTDSRSGVQVAAAEGSVRKADIKLGGLFAGIVPGAAALGGYTNTNEGKVIASALLDNYNNIVKAIKGNPSLQRDVGTLAEESGKKAKSGAVFNEGDVLRPKIANVKLFAQPAEGKVVATLSRGDELIFMGEEKDGFISVESGSGSGWVKKVLVSR